ncbi:MAG: ribokinase [Eubacteriales bacterium]|nr:ribokinase [Eubacteriales bacterium]
MKIVVIGSINTDLVINTERLPRIGETINGSGFSVNCGGKGANQAIAAAKLGGDVSFIGAVGNDANGEMALGNLKTGNVSTTYIEKVSVNTGVAVITVAGGDNCIVLDSGANGMITKEIIDKNEGLIKSADAVIMQLEIPMETVTYAAQVAKRHNVKVILNPAPIIALPKELTDNTDVIILNETEAEFITGTYPDTKENGKECINKLKSMGIEQAIITLGGDGSIYNDGDEIIHQPAFKADVVDSTAAGDTFIGAYTIRCDLDIKERIVYATAASSITVSRKGASSSIPTRDEVEEYLAKQSY